MRDVSCILAGLTLLLGPPLILFLWHRKSGARLLPAPAAFAACIPVFIVGASIRSGFSHSDAVAYYVQQGILFGILEEGAKYLMLRYALTSYDSRKDAVTYGIGHSAYEEFGTGLACFGLIGSGDAPSDLLWVDLFSFIEGTVTVCALTVIVFYGIYADKSIVTLPAAILLHAVSNAASGLFIFSKPIVFGIDILMTAAECFIAYRCWREMQPPFDDTQ